MKRFLICFLCLAHAISQQLSYIHARQEDWQQRELRARFDVTKEHGPIVNRSICPCRSTRHEQRDQGVIQQARNICFINNTAYQSISPHISVYTVITSYFNLKSSSKIDCDLIIEVIHAQPLDQACGHKYICPESCLPKPFTTVPINWLLEKSWRNDPSIASSIAVTCSMSMSELLQQSNTSSIDEWIQIIANRRIMECHESEYWPATMTIAQPSRRKIYGLIIWVGSRSRLEMAIAQIQILKHQYRFPSEDRIVGWIASEEQYPCRPQSTRCPPPLASDANLTMLLKASEINEESFGWSCAQRRPLRSLAHTLHLYDPSFIFLIDDDTYVNATFFEPTSRLNQAIKSYLASQTVVLGFLETKHRLTGGRITKRGILYGGRGYLLGKAVLNSLQSHQILGPRVYEDAFRDPMMMRHLSILRQAHQLAASHCDSSCLQLMTPDGSWIDYGSVGKFAVRLVDVCMNLLSDEHTCYHSDHAMTRCLAHAVYASMIHIGCENSTIGIHSIDDSNRLPIRTCGYHARKAESMLSCHRLIYQRPDLSDKERAYRQHGGKKVKSEASHLMKHAWC
jgi:hypothetical protein